MRTRNVAVVATVSLMALTLGAVVAAAPPLWAAGVVVAFALALVVGLLGSAARVKPTFEAIGQLAAAGALGMAAMNDVAIGAVKLSSPLLVSDALLLVAGAILIPLGLTRRLTVSCVPAWLLTSGALLLLAGLLSSLASADPAGNGVPAIQFTTALVLVPLVVGFAMGTPRLLRAAAVLYAVSSAISGAVAVADLVGGAGYGTSLGGLMWFGRSAGLAVHPTTLALAAAMALPIEYFLIITSKRLTERTIMSLLFLPTIGGILASGARTGLICGVVGMALVVLLTRKGGAHTRALGGVTVLGLLALIAVSALGWGQLMVGVDRLTGVQSVGYSDLTRLEYYGEALDAFAASPLFGTGFSTVRVAHDIYLQLIEAGGVLALTAFAIFVIGSLRLGLRLCRDAELPEALQRLAAAATASMLTWLVGGLVTTQIYDRYLYVPCGLLIGIVIVARSPVAQRRNGGLSSTQASSQVPSRSTSGVAVVNGSVSLGSATVDPRSNKGPIR